MRSKFESVVTLPTDERVVGVPGGVVRAAAAGRPHLEN